MTPVRISVEGAIPNETYREGLEVQNPNDRAVVIELTLAGEVGSWTETTPGTGFEVPPESARSLQVDITVPGDAVNGTYEGELRITADPKDDPDGSGSSFRPSVTVPLTVQVGGDPVERLRWVEAAAHDVEVGSPSNVTATVVNEGNVRTLAEATVAVLNLHDDSVRDEVEGSVLLIPGERATIRFPLQVAPPEGQYRARVTSQPNGTFDEVRFFKVVPPGTLGKDGTLRFIQHEPWVDVGLPVAIHGVFENTGEVGIARARFTGQIHLDGTLVGTLESEPLVVNVGARVNLTDFFTPTTPGVHVIRGHVTYDGFVTPTLESILNVEGTVPGDGLGANPILPYAGALLLALLVGLLLFAWHRRDEEENDER